MKKSLRYQHWDLVFFLFCLFFVDVVISLLCSCILQLKWLAHWFTVIKLKKISLTDKQLSIECKMICLIIKLADTANNVNIDFISKLSMCFKITLFCMYIFAKSCLILPVQICDYCMVYLTAAVSTQIFLIHISFFKNKTTHFICFATRHFSIYNRVSKSNKFNRLLWQISDNFLWKINYASIVTFQTAHFLLFPSLLYAA